MTLTKRQLQRINMLRAAGHSARSIVAQTGYPRAAVQDACRITPEEREKRRREFLAGLLKMRPPERSEEAHERVLRASFPEAFAEAGA